MKAILLLSFFFYTVYASSIFINEELSYEDPAKLFVYFQEKFYRQYHNEAERNMRYQYFLINLKNILRLRANNPHAQFGITSFSDLSLDEIHRQRPRLKPLKPDQIKKRNQTSSPHVLETVDAKDLPLSVDWRSQGAVTPIRDQLVCGSCWAFAIVAVTESQWFIKHGTLPMLSEQMLVSCDQQANGCNGAFPEYAVRGIIEGYGGKMSLRSTYPYASGLSYNPPCDESLISPAAVISGDQEIDSNEDAMMKWVAQHGPIVVAIDSTDLSHYTNGIITSATSEQIDHAVAIVGYGNSTETGDNIPYWIIRNSWGGDWGEEGYFRILRGGNLMLVATYPLAVLVGDNLLTE